MTLMAPIEDPESIDIVGERKGGGADLVLVCAGPLDGSPETLRILEQTVDNYLKAATHPNFPIVYPAAKSGPIRIFVMCEHHVADASRILIATCAQRAADVGIELSLVKTMD